MRKFSQREVGTIWRDRQFDKIRQELSKIVEKFRTWSNAWHTSSKHRNFSPRLRCFFVNVTFFIEFIILPYTRALIDSLIILLDFLLDFFLDYSTPKSLDISKDFGVIGNRLFPHR